MPTKTLYSRPTIRKIMKAHTNRRISKNADILIFLDYMLFMEDLVREANINARENKEKRLTPRAVREVTEISLDRFKC